MATNRIKLIIVICILALSFVLYATSANAQSIFCAPNSQPRTCASSQVCTINGDCSLLQGMYCCLTTIGFPTNTPTPMVITIPTPTDLPSFPSPSPTPTSIPSSYTGTLTAWYTQNLSNTGEIISKALPDSSGQYLYIVGRSNINENGGGWVDGSLGFIKKLRISDKSVIWTKTIGQYLGYYVGGIHNVREDGSGVYISGYLEWGSKLYTAKLDATNGVVVWELSESAGPNTIWSLNRGLGIDADNTYLYIAGSSMATSGSGQTERWTVLRKRKSDGVTDLSRIVDLTAGADIAKSVVLTGAYAIVAGERNGVWYIEKLNKSTLATVVTISGSNGSISDNSVIIDGTYFYVTGYQTSGTKGRLRIEKRNISNLRVVWSYLAPDTGVFQSNTHPTIYDGQLVVVANEDHYQNYWQDARIVFLNTQTGSATKNTLYTGVGYVGALSISSTGSMYMSGSLPTNTDGAIYFLNEITYTPTPTPTIPTVAGCSQISWVDARNVTTTGNSITGNSYPAWNFENGANSSATATKGTPIGGYAEIPPHNPNYGAMWGLSAINSEYGWIDYSWYAPYYSGNEMFIILPGRSAISMGTGNPGDRFGVQLSDGNIVFTKSLAGTSTWEVQYIMADVDPDILTNTVEFRARVAGYSTVYRANVGTSCQLVTLPTPTTIPTGPVGGNLTPWYSTNLSSYPELGSQVYPDATGNYVYLVGRKNIGSPFGWHQSSTGFIQKIRKSDKQLIWNYNISSSNHSGLFDVKEGSDGVYVTGFTWWGTNLYTAKINSDTGAKIWSSEDYIGWSWFPYKGVGFDMDDDYLYVASNSTNSDLDTNFSIVKKSKQNGSTVASRSVDFSSDWDAVTSIVVHGGYVYVGGYKSYDTPQWYIEKLNANDLSLITSATGVSGVIDMHGMRIENGYLYVGGFEITQGSRMWSSVLRTRVHVEKLRLNDLGQVWSFGFPLDHMWQGSTSLVIHNGEVLATANDTMDRVGWFGSSWVGINLRFIRISDNNGKMIDTMAYSGVGNVGGLNKDISGDIFLSGSTTNRALTAIFKIDELIINTVAPFGMKVTQRVLTQNVVRGGPIQIAVDIENATNATQAGWAFGFVDQVPSSIIGVVWDCEVVKTGIPINDMAAYPTRCGYVDSGSGNDISFSHSSNADPLIHPGGKITVTISGVVAPNASLIQNTALIYSYPGWTQDHYYTVNFMSSPTDYTTLPDNDPTDNTSTTNINVLAVTGTPVPTSTTNSPTPTTSPYPTIPIPYIPSCLNQSQILQAVVNGQIQYYCEDNDPTGHNMIMISDGVIEKLNSSATQVENVTYVHKPSIDNQELVTISFTVKTRASHVVAGGRIQSRQYSMVVRMR